MRFRIELLAASLGACLLTLPAPAGEAATNGSTTATISTNTPEKVGYAYGVNIGATVTNTIQRYDINANVDEIINAFRDVLKGGQVKMTPDEAQQILRSYQQEKQREAMEKLKALAEKNEKEGAAFLAENKKKPGVQTKEVTLPDGKTAELQYKVITQGTGETPKSNDTVTVKYRGTLINGTEFDSSEKHGGQAKFQVNQIIKGWSEALQMMKVGAKWELYIPSSLAYGERQMGTIEPGSTLIFEVELLEVEAPKPVATGMSQQPLTSDIVRVPSAEERQKGVQPRIITPAEAEQMAREEAAKQQQQQQKKQ